VNWQRFATEAPELASLGQELFDDSELCLVGTLRRDGSPRISPVEPYIVDGELLLGMMWRSRKALDLLRDPRVVVHSTQCDREATSGDFKLYGRAVDVPDPETRARYGDATEARIDWRPDGPFHLFRVDIDSAGYISFGDKRIAMRWSREEGFARMKHPDDP
jgi:hypothetical protein